MDLQKDEWTQQEYLRAKREFAKSGREILLVDTIARPIEGVDTVLYNPYVLEKYPPGTVLEPISKIPIGGNGSQSVRSQGERRRA